MEKVTALLNKLTNWWWSPQHPTTYTLSNGSGLGKIALKDPAAFNLAWLKHRTQLGEYAGQHLAVSYFAKLETELLFEINGVSVASYVTLLRPGEFNAWYSGVRMHIPATGTLLIDSAFHDTTV